MKQLLQASGLLLFSFTLTAAAAAPADRLPPISPDTPFSFVVLGDNRGDDSGQQPPAFIQVLAAIGRETPALILDSGDMVYGHTRDADELEAQWRIYQHTVSGVRVPIFHVPGNHDLWNQASSEIYRRLWGPTHYAFTYGNSRFIALDTETASGRLDDQQVKWLEAELRACRLPNVFLFMHRPLFPVDGGIGSSLDAHPEQRDRLHRLFIQYAPIIRAVFAGHEHLYSYQQRDGIRYYTSGGGGAPLYMAPERGGFHHFLQVNVTGPKVEVNLHKVCAPGAALLTPRLIVPGEVLESWNQGLICFSWDRTTSLELTDAQAREGTRSLRLNFDLTQYAWPVLVLPFVSPRDFSDASFLCVDLFVPTNLARGLSVVFAAQGAQEHQAPAVKLTPGWNSIRTRLDPSWLPLVEQSRLQSLQWALSSRDPRGTGYILFDNLRIERRRDATALQPEQLEGWERRLLWRVFDEAVRAQIRGSTNSPDTAGLSLHLEGTGNSRPVLFAQLNPPWDITQVSALLLNATVDKSAPADLRVEMILRAKDTDFIAPPLPLRSGVAPLRFELDRGWLPNQPRAAIEQVAFRFVTTNVTVPAELLFQKLAAELKP